VQFLEPSQAASRLLLPLLVLVQSGEGAVIPSVDYHYCSNARTAMAEGHGEIVKSLTISIPPRTAPLPKAIKEPASSERGFFRQARSASFPGLSRCSPIASPSWSLGSLPRAIG
jgi:hypothetical protein